jgi:hypothetical protein
MTMAVRVGHCNKLLQISLDLPPPPRPLSLSLSLACPAATVQQPRRQAHEASATRSHRVPQKVLIPKLPMYQTLFIYYYYYFIYNMKCNIIKFGYFLIIERNEYNNLQVIE